MATPSRSWLRAAAVMTAGAAAIALGARVSVPMVPVPTTLQTLAVVGVGLLAGPRLGAAAAALYLVLALTGLPVLSDGEPHPGLAFLGLATAGYVVGFVPAAAVAGHLGRKGGFARLSLAGLAAHAVVFALGVPVLTGWIGLGPAVQKGLLPFLLGALVKSLVAAGAVWAYRQPSPRGPHSEG